MKNINNLEDEKNTDEFEKRQERGFFIGYFILLIIIGGLLWLAIIIRGKIPSWVFLIFLKIPTIILMIIALVATAVAILKLLGFIYSLKERKKKSEEA